MKPRSINIFLLDGDPIGIRVAQVSMSTIQAIAFRRNQLRRVLGIKDGTLTRWQDFLRFELDNAQKAINHLGGFHGG